MKESLVQIAKVIAHAKQIFEKEHMNGVVARVRGVFDGEEKTYWFTVNENKTVFWNKPHINELGRFVSRNTRVAVRILNEELGSVIEYELIGIPKRLKKHCIVAENKCDLVNKFIAMAGDSQLYYYDDIYDFLLSLQNKAEEIEENERLQREREQKIEELKKQENTAHERSVLTKALNELKEQHRILTLQKEAMSNLTRFIRKQNQLRFNPILDKVQNRIKTDNLFNGRTVIINGGPGTGKTTTMIQRLKYLTDTVAINEDFEEGIGCYKLTPANRDKLFTAIKQNEDWMFFSPSELLKSYLSAAMNNEGLGGTDYKVCHWGEFCKTTIRDDYHLIRPADERSPFKISKIKDILIYQNSNAIEDFEQYYLDYFRTIKERLPKISRGDVLYKWSAMALGIKERLEKASEMNLYQFITLFNSLSSAYSEDCKELIKENRDTIRGISEELNVLLSTDSKKRNIIESLLVNNSNNAQEDIDEETEMTEDEVTDKITALIRNWFKRYCYSLQNKEVMLTQRQQQLCELLLPLLTEKHKAKIARVGELVLFEQFAKYTRGARSVLLEGFPGKYKRFRRLMLSRKSAGWNLDVLNELVNKNEGKGLHFQEQSLLVGFINNVVKSLIRLGTKDTSHDYIQAYLRWNRPIIGIDEATDFSIYDIYAMESFLSIDYNSLTLCGDMMQRLTRYGITSWADIESVVQSPTVVDMKTSYRQSTTLLNVATRLYTDTIGVEPNYKAHMNSTKVPKPLAFVSSDEREKVDWIEKRIGEVYNAYGKQLPSIAIFLNNKKDIPEFIECLNETDFIVDADITITDGSAGNVLASERQIRVYPIDVVKGMEFDVVFFHNIDNSIYDNELIQRYIYVGVSRAAFFLGVTLNEKNDAMCKYFEMNQQWDKI